jgi:hypothetical protein
LPGGAKTFVYTRVFNLGDFDPKKQSFLKDVPGFFRPISELLSIKGIFLKFGLAALFSPFQYFAMNSTPKCTKR